MNAPSSTEPDIFVRRSVAIISAVSLVILAFLFWVIYFAPPLGDAPRDQSILPPLNAALNALSATFAITGLIFIKRGAKKAHAACMVAATVASAAFLVGYLAYHSLHGDTKFLAQGFVRTLYFLLLVPHIILSMVLVPLLLCTIFFAASHRFNAHKKFARWTYPIWLYVSVSGVAVFFFLRFLNHA